ncbi:hypothetical protein Aperf_G00000124249 [Anoplocephala perfoliata]
MCSLKPEHLNALTGEVFDPLNDPHPVFCCPELFSIVFIGKNPFFLDSTKGDLVPAFLHALFIHIHRDHLRSLEEDGYSFTDSILSDEQKYGPEVVDIPAKFLLCKTKSYEDSLAIISQRDALYNSFVLREILRLSGARLLFLNFDTCELMDNNNILFPCGLPCHVKLDGIFPVDFIEGKKNYESVLTLHQNGVRARRMSQLMAAINCHIFRDMNAVQARFHRSVTRLIFYHLSVLVRVRAIKECAHLKCPLNRFYIPFCAGVNEHVFHTIRNIAYQMADVCIFLDPRWAAHKYATRHDVEVDMQEYVEKKERRLKIRAMMNILCINNNCLWLTGTTFDDFIEDEVTGDVVKEFQANFEEGLELSK